MTPTLRVTIPRRIEAALKAQAKAAFPKETFAFVIGTVAGDTVHVDEIHTPANVAEHATKSYVEIQSEWWAEAAEKAKEESASIVAWVHSHPYDLAWRKRRKNRLMLDHAPSQTDYDCRFPLLLNAVCVVQEQKRNGKVTLRASMRWWGLSIPLEITRV